MSPPTKEEYEAAKQLVNDYYHLVIVPQDERGAILKAKSLVGKFCLEYSSRLSKVVKAEGSTIFVEQIDFSDSSKSKDKDNEHFRFSTTHWDNPGLGDYSGSKFISKSEAKQIIEQFIKRLQGMLE